MMAWLLSRYGAHGLLVVAIVLATAIGTAQLVSSRWEARLVAVMAERDVARLQAADCSAGVERLEAQARQARQAAAKAAQEARAAAEVRRPQIDALAAAAARPEAPERSCGDALEVIRAQLAPH